MASDRIYAFLGLANDSQDLAIIPDYSAPTSKVFSDIARALIIAHKHLLLFNLKREPVAEQQRIQQQQSQVYSLLDQARFFDPNGSVVEGGGRIPRKGWVRLPHGWERCQDGSRVQFYNHVNGEYKDASPLVDQSPVSPQRMNFWRNLPSGWTKSWDNVGNAQFVFNVKNPKLDPTHDTDLEILPSWVPDWTKWSSKDPEPFPSLVDEKPRYWASGEARKVHFASGYVSNSQTLKLTGILFDKIES